MTYERSIILMAGWLIANLAAIRMDEAAAQIHDELTGLGMENGRAIFGRGETVFAGQCDTPDVFLDPDTNEITITDRICGVALYGYQNEAKLRCPACDMIYDLAERLEKRDREQINDTLARPHQIANALTTLEGPLSPTLLRKWIQRDAEAEESPEGPPCISCGHRTCQLIRRVLILPKGFDEHDKPLYRFGDVRARLELVQAQRGVKMSA